MRLRLLESQTSELRSRLAPVFGPMLRFMPRGMPAGCRKLMGFIPGLSPPQRPALFFDQYLMPTEILLTPGEPAPQVPLYPRRKAFGIEARLLFSPLNAQI
ncbi:MAG: hypothetical protein HY765_10000 [Rhodomicrobium sp.]|nr:hypothetical protein [Rhodomicrobium sp.]